MMDIWPDTPFEEIMLDSGSSVIIHCPDEELVVELFGILKANGVSWAGSWDTMDITHWEKEYEDTCYRVMPEKKMRHGTVYCYQSEEYNDCIKCTFYGTDTEDIDINEDEFLALLGAGGE